MVGTILVWLCLGVLCTGNHVTRRKFFGRKKIVNDCNKTSENCKSEDSDHSLTLYEYDQFNFCTANKSYTPSENQNQTLSQKGARPFSYKLEFLEDVNCRTMCQKVYSSSRNETINGLEFLKKGMASNYHHFWTVGDMPVEWCPKLEEWSPCISGTPMGCFNIKEETCRRFGTYNKPDTYYLFNHVDLTITYHRVNESSPYLFKENAGQIIDAKAVPRSIKHGSNPDCGSKVPLEISNVILPSDQQLAVTYTFSVKFVEENGWPSGLPVEKNYRMYVIPYSLIIALVASGIAAMIMIYTLPITPLKKMVPEERESGWQVLRGDVFRPPRNGLLLSAFLGSGATTFFMSFIALAFLSMGSTVPAKNNKFMTFAMLSSVCVYSIAGYVSALMYKSFSGEKWKWNILVTSMLTPGVISTCFFLANSVFLDQIEQINGISTVSMLLALGTTLGLPISMTVIGAYFGFKRKPLRYPVAANEGDPRPIPKQKALYVIMRDIVPFVCISIQLFALLKDFLLRRVPYTFEPLMLFFIFIITYSETTILVCYFHLCAGNYHWWWRSFLTSGSTAFYMSIRFFYDTRGLWKALELQLMFLYFEIFCIIAISFFFLTGSIGFFACFWFVRRIYSVKQDVHIAMISFQNS